MIRLRHLGWSGVAVEIEGDVLLVDPPEPAGPEVPVMVTWTEQERVRGARGSAGPLAAAPEVLRWLGRDGAAFAPEGVRLGAFTLHTRPFTPIPYATAPEALRKARSALRSPRLALGRLRATAGRPPSPPHVVRIEHPGGRVFVAGQALHRFVSEAEGAALLAWAGEVDVAVAGPDYDDEAACGHLLGRLHARSFVVADLTGPIRRHLGLPVRPLEHTLAAAPPGARLLTPGGSLEF